MAGMQKDPVQAHQGLFLWGEKTSAVYEELSPKPTRDWRKNFLSSSVSLNGCCWLNASSPRLWCVSYFDEPLAASRGKPAVMSAIR